MTHFGGISYLSCCCNRNCFCHHTSICTGNRTSVYSSSVTTCRCPHFTCIKIYISFTTTQTLCQFMLTEERLSANTGYGSAPSPITFSLSLRTSNKSSRSQFEILMGHTFDSLHSKSAVRGQREQLRPSMI